jgi:hypothetical protein
MFSIVPHALASILRVALVHVGFCPFDQQPDSHGMSHLCVAWGSAPRAVWLHFIGYRVVFLDSISLSSFASASNPVQPYCAVFIWWHFWLLRQGWEGICVCILVPAFWNTFLKKRTAVDWLTSCFHQSFVSFSSWLWYAMKLLGKTLLYVLLYKKAWIPLKRM